MSGPIVLALRFLAAAALYAFLGWALYLMWNTLRSQISALSTQHITPLKIIQMDTSQVFEFAKSDVIIGRDGDCECLLEDTTVSARHARLAYHHNQWWLEDLDSKNGTTLNEEKVVLPTVITNGDTIRCGQSTLAVLVEDAEQRYEETKKPSNAGEML